ncbi:MAG: ATP-binding protein [Patescibacteria group bacterium]|nr:ATP-binding protein [Patescibacteria group bacterium]
MMEPPFLPALSLKSRYFVTGRTQTGKSTLARDLAKKLSSAGPPLLIIDPKDDDITKIKGCERFSDPLRIPPSDAVFTPSDSTDIDAYRSLFAQFVGPGKWRPRTYWIDEAGSVLPQSGLNREARTLLAQGSGKGIPVIMCHTRPCEIDVNSRAQATDIIAFETPSSKDRRIIADTAGIDITEIDPLLRPGGMEDHSAIFCQGAKMWIISPS